MEKNPKMPVSFRNRTNYFNPDTDRTIIRLSSPNTYQTRQTKIEGIEARLYWHYQYCKKMGMPVYFYTLTYNDKAIPDFFGVPCFDYENLRDFFRGKFYKEIRKYGLTFKYFVGAELGEGAGKRGFHNNPHYHILFFLEPKKYVYTKKEYTYNPIGFYVKRSKNHNIGDTKYKKQTIKTKVEIYGKIPTDQEFTHLVRLYWQGFDQDYTKERYENSLYGIAKEGKFGCRVKDFKALSYCSKYVCKDAFLKSFEVDARRLLEERFEIDNERRENESPFEYETRRDQFINESIKEYRNRFCNKCRISHGVGEYAINYIDKKDPYITMPDKANGYKRRPISLYYYRKIYCNVEKDKNAQNLYVLNQAGIDLKVSQLEKRLQKLAEKTFTNCELMANNPNLYNEILESNCNLQVDMSYNDFMKKIENSINETRRNRDFRKDTIFRRYGEYKLVYEDRYFYYKTGRNDLFNREPNICLLPDYREFLEPSFYKTSYSYRGAIDFLETKCKDYLSYDSHTYFHKYLCLFNCFDMLSNYLSIQMDNKKEREDEERRKIKKFHIKNELKEYYERG